MPSRASCPRAWSPTRSALHRPRPGPVSVLPWITLARPVKAPTANRTSLARTRLRVCWSISLPESPSRPGNQVAAAVAKEATLMAL